MRNFSGTYNHCFTGYLEGFKSCTQSISGRYIVIPLINSPLRISELLAYDAPLVDVTLDRYEDMTYQTSSGDEARMFDQYVSVSLYNDLPIFLPQNIDYNYIFLNVDPPGTVVESVMI